MEWSIFQIIFDNVGPPVISAVNAIVAALQGWMRPVLLTGIPLAVMLQMLWKSLRGSSGGPLNDMASEIVAGSVIFYLATEAAGFGPQLRDLLLGGLSREIGAAITGAIGVPAVSANLFDDLWARCWVTGVKVFNVLPGWSLKSVGLTLVVVLFWFASMAAVGVAFLIWLTSYVMIALLVGLWPLGVGLFAFKWTRFLGWGWVRIALANVLLQVLVIACGSTLIAVMRKVLDTIQTSMAVDSMGNELRQVGMLIGACLVVALFAWLMKQLPGLAASWTHGFTGFGHVPNMAFSLPSWRNDAAAGSQGSGHQAGGSVATDNAGGGGAVPSAMTAIPLGLPPGRSVG